MLAVVVAKAVFEPQNRISACESVVGPRKTPRSDSLDEAHTLSVWLKENKAGSKLCWAYFPSRVTVYLGFFL